MTNSAFGIATPITNPTQIVPLGGAPYSFLGATYPYMSSQPYGQPLNVPLGSFTSWPYAQSTQQVLLQLLQIVPQQLQQLQQLIVVQHQQIQQIQQLLQLIPGQVAQLHQLVPQQLSPAPTGFAMTPPWGIASQALAQPGYVM